MHERLAAVAVRPRRILSLPFPSWQEKLAVDHDSSARSSRPREGPEPYPVRACFGLSGPAGRQPTNTHRHRTLHMAIPLRQRPRRDCKRQGLLGLACVNRGHTDVTADDPEKSRRRSGDEANLFSYIVYFYLAPYPGQFRYDFAARLGRLSKPSSPSTYKKEYKNKK